MNALTDPAFIAALATLVTAVAALVKIFHVDVTTKINQAGIQEVKDTTNGNNRVLQEQVDSQRRHIALLEKTVTPALPPDPPQPPR